MSKPFSLEYDLYPLLKLAIPLALTGLVQSTVWFFETLFLAQLGQDILAAGSLVSWLYATIIVIIFGIFSSINILVAHRYGAKDYPSIEVIAKDGILLAVLITVPTFLLFWNMAPIFLLFDQPATIVVLANSYLHALAWGILANCLTIACLEVIIGMGGARVIFVFSVFTVSINIVASYVLIFGKWGFPALGITGAGWGITLSYWLTLLGLVIFILTSPTYRRYFRQWFSFKRPQFLGELIQVGLPIGLMYCVEVGFFLALTLCMGSLSTEILAANQIVMQFLSLFMSIMFALAQAVTVRIGYLIGARQAAHVAYVNYLGIFGAGALMFIIGLGYWFWPRFLIGLDLDLNAPNNAKLIIIIEQLLIISAIFQVFEAMRIILFGSLRGFKDTNFTLLTSIISFWLLALPIGYGLAVYLGMGGSGFWWALVAGAIFSVIVLQLRFNFKLRQHLRT